jgi:hypothetical protein
MLLLPWLCLCCRISQRLWRHVMQPRMPFGWNLGGFGIAFKQAPTPRTIMQLRTLSAFIVFIAEFIGANLAAGHPSKNQSPNVHHKPVFSSCAKQFIRHSKCGGNIAPLGICSKSSRHETLCTFRFLILEPPIPSEMKYRMDKRPVSVESQIRFAEPIIHPNNGPLGDVNSISP